MEQIKGNPHFKGILNLMAVYLMWVIDSTHEMRNLKLVGDILREGDLPKKESDIRYIIKRLEAMVESCIGIKRVEEAQDYLVDLVEEIRMIFLRTLLIEFFIKKEDVKIILNDGTEIIIIENSLNFMSDPITGITSENEEVVVNFSDIKLKGGISPLDVTDRLHMEDLDTKGCEKVK